MPGTTSGHDEAARVGVCGHRVGSLGHRMGHAVGGQWWPCGCVWRKLQMRTDASENKRTPQQAMRWPCGHVEGVVRVAYQVETNR
jgi:hypothetical protein